jgi:hypothetical protein
MDEYERAGTRAVETLEDVRAIDRRARDLADRDARAVGTRVR